MRNLIDMIEVPEVGLVATEVLNRDTPDIHEALKEAEVCYESPWDPDSKPNNLILSCSHMHGVVASLAEIHEKPYKLPRAEEYLKIIEFAKGTGPEIPKFRKSILLSLEVINGQIVETEDGRKLYQNYGFRRRKPGEEPEKQYPVLYSPTLWIKTKGEYVDVPKEVRIMEDNIYSPGIIAWSEDPNEISGKYLWGIESGPIDCLTGLLNPTGRIILR